jgi:hypothetical protein
LFDLIESPNFGLISAAPQNYEKPSESLPSKKISSTDFSSKKISPTMEAPIKKTSAITQRSANDAPATSKLMTSSASNLIKSETSKATSNVMTSSVSQPQLPSVTKTSQNDVAKKRSTDSGNQKYVSFFFL